VLLGRYGPYIKCVKETRSVPEGTGALALTFEEALAALAAPRSRRGSDPGTVVGSNPDSGAEIRLKKGRYGPYVTDGTTNASLPKGQDAAAITLESALELLAARAAKGPSKRKKTRKTTKKARKTTTKARKSRAKPKK
jgi:DNA topoisomerase-1